jgi:hypothetical protein
VVDCDRFIANNLMTNRKGHCMLPFHVDKLFKANIEGTALPQSAGLKLVFHAPEEDQNIFDAEIEEVMVRWDNLAAIEIKRGLFGAAVALTVKSDAVFPRLLKPKDNQLTLTIRRRDKAKLDRFERELTGFRSGELASDTEEFIDDMRDFLDRM